MQAAVERVFRSFSLKRPAQVEASNPQDGAMQDDNATEIAAQLLQNYRDHLAQQCWQTDRRLQD